MACSIAHCSGAQGGTAFVVINPIFLIAKRLLKEKPKIVFIILNGTKISERRTVMKQIFSDLVK